MSRGAACCAPTYYVGTPLMSAHIGGLNARPHARHRPCPLRRVFWRQYGQVRRRPRLAHRAPAGFDPREVADPRGERGGERDTGGGFHERPDSGHRQRLPVSPHPLGVSVTLLAALTACGRSEEHTSELQSQSNLVCRLLLEKKKTTRDCEDGEPSRPPQPLRVNPSHRN